MRENVALNAQALPRTRADLLPTVMFSQPQPITTIFLLLNTRKLIYDP
jgi:hypothetical protein